jgi:ABC-type sugar transport system permease subunit
MGGRVQGCLERGRFLINAGGLGVLRMTKQKSIHVDKVAYLMIAPYYIFLILFILLPIVINAALSFTDYNLNTMHFVGLANYSRMLRDPILQRSVLNTFLYTIITLTLTVGLGLMVSILITKTGKLISTIRTVVFMPYVISMASASMIWLWIYEPGYGLLNSIITLFGGTAKDWVYDINLALGCVVAVTVWKFLGYNMVIYTAGLMNIPGQLYEAAMIDGANAWVQFVHVTLPMLRPTTFFLMVTGFINNFNVFEQVKILTNGGPVNSTTTIMHQIYNRGFIDYQFGYAAAITMILMIVVSIITALNFRYGSRGQDLDLS